MTETEKEVVVEASIEPSPRTPHLVDVDAIPRAKKAEGADCDGHLPSAHCHPLCRLPFVNDIKHTGENRSCICQVVIAIREESKW